MLQDMRGKLTAKHVRVYVDNTTAVTCIRKGGSAKSKECHAETEKIYKICKEESTHISVKYCPGVDNVQADRASRVFTDAGEWSLNTKTISDIFKEYGTPEIDMFASGKKPHIRQVLYKAI